MLDVRPIRAHVRSVMSVMVADGNLHVGEVESTEVVSFMCEEHPEFLWNGVQWDEVLKHLITHHSGSGSNGHAEKSPFHDGSHVGEQVDIGIEPPGGEESGDGNPSP